MTSLRISPGLLPSEVVIPTSKSYANRALILGALKKQPLLLADLPKASDVTFLLEALKHIGLQLKATDSGIVIENSFPECEKGEEITISVGEGGTTARFLACMLATGKSSYRLLLGKRLKERPWNDFIKQVQDLGGRASLADDVLFIQGPLKIPSLLEVNCSLTTQYASGFQLALAFSSTEVRPTKLSTSMSYWEMTKEMIKQVSTHDSFTIPKDWSSASYPLCLAAIKQKVFFPGLHFDAFQADAKLLEILKKMKASQESPEGLIVAPSGFSGDLKIDASDCLDLVPALGFLLSQIKGTHFIEGLENLKHKESDRLSEVHNLLQQLGYKVGSDEKSLTIEGDPLLKIKAVDLALPDDHRMVMTASLFLRSHEGGSVTPALAVNKSYPEFFHLFE